MCVQPTTVCVMLPKVCVSHPQHSHTLFCCVFDGEAGAHATTKHTGEAAKVAALREEVSTLQSALDKHAAAGTNSPASGKAADTIRDLKKQGRD